MLGFVLHRDEDGTWLPGCPDGVRIRGIGLVPLDEWAYGLRSQEADIVARLDKLTTPFVSTAAGLHDHSRRLPIREPQQHLRPLELQAFELVQHRWVVSPPSQRSMWLGEVGQLEEVAVDGDIVTDSTAARLAFVLAGVGIARLPAQDAATPLATGDLGQVLPQLQTAPLEIYLVHGRRVGPSARLLRDFLRSPARRED